MDPANEAPDPTVGATGAQPGPRHDPPPRFLGLSKAMGDRLAAEIKGVYIDQVEAHEKDQVVGSEWVLRQPGSPGFVVFYLYVSAGRNEPWLLDKFGQYRARATPLLRAFVLETRVASGQDAACGWMGAVCTRTHTHTHKHTQTHTHKHAGERRSLHGQEGAGEPLPCRRTGRFGDGGAWPPRDASGRLVRGRGARARPGRFRPEADSTA